MAAQNTIELGFDIAKLTDEKKQVLDLYVDLFGKLQSYQGKQFNPTGNGGLGDLKKSIQDSNAALKEYNQTAAKYNEVVTQQYNNNAKAKKATDDLSAAEKEHKRNLDTLASTKAKIAESDTNAANDRAIEVQRLQAINKEVNANARAYLSEIGSVNEAKATIAQLTIERDKLNATTDQGKQKIVELNAKIDLNNQFIKENASTLEQQKINIGNYIGAVDVLKESLSVIDGRLESMAAAGNTASESYQKLVFEQNLLKTLLDKTSQGFSTVTAEMRATRSALDALEVAGLQNSEAFEKLNVTYTTAKQKITELHDQQKILTSETPGLTALTAVARGLGGAYALGAGASALFADGNEKVEKELNKLVAVMTALQGLEETVKAIRESGAIGIALQATATKLYAAAKEIETKILGESTAITIAETESKIANAGATDVQTASDEALTVAEGEATAGALALRAALIATGVGAVIAVIVGLVEIMSKLGAEEKEAAEEASKLYEQISKLNDEIITNTKLAGEATEKLKQYLQTELSYSEKNNSNYYEQFAIKKQIADVDIKIAENSIKSVGNSSDLATAYQNIEKSSGHLKKNLEDAGKVATDLREKAIALQVVASSSAGNVGADFLLNRNAKSATEAADAADKEYATIKTLYDNRNKLLRDYDKSQSDNVSLEIERAKFSDKEQTEILLNETKIRATAIQQLNNFTLGNDKATQQQKISALQSNLAQELIIIEAERKAKLADTLLTPAARQTVNDDQNAAAKKATADFQEANIKLTEEFYQRYIAAESALQRSRITAVSSANDAIAKDETKSFDARIDAYKNYLGAQHALADEEFSTKLKSAGFSQEQINAALAGGKVIVAGTKLTNEEIEALEQEHGDKLKEIDDKAYKEVYDITVGAMQRKLKAIEELNKASNTSNDVTENYNEQSDALEKSLAKNLFGYDKYLRDKQNLDNQYSIDKAAADLADDEASLKRLNDFLFQELDLKKSIASLGLTTAKSNGNDTEIKEAQAKYDALLDQEKFFGAQSVELSKKINDDKQKLDAATNARNIQGAAQVSQLEKQIEQAAFDFAKTLVDASYENKINALEAEQQKVDEQAQAEIAAVQRSTLSTRDQAAEVIIIQAQQKSADTALKNQEKQEKRKEAVADRDFAVAQAEWDGAAAALGALKTYAGTPYGFVVAGLIEALTQIKVATILAKPIPSFGEGVTNFEGGLALTGEKKVNGRFQPERINEPGKKPYVVDRPTLLNLAHGSSVTPLNADTIVSEIGAGAIARGAIIVNMEIPKSDATADAINNQTRELKKAIAKNNVRVINKINNIVEPMDWNRHKKIYGT